jgi:hypothetical protein
MSGRGSTGQSSGQREDSFNSLSQIGRSPVCFYTMYSSRNTHLTENSRVARRKEGGNEINQSTKYARKMMLPSLKSIINQVQYPYLYIPSSAF